MNGQCFVTINDQKNIQKAMSIIVKAHSILSPKIILLGSQHDSLTEVSRSNKKSSRLKTKKNASFLRFWTAISF